MSGGDIAARLAEIGREVQVAFRADRRILSFAEYVELVAADPLRHTRDAARYVLDAFEHYGRETRRLPTGESTRFRLFDLPFLAPEAAERQRLVGQERVQEELHRALGNFVRDGRANRLLLLHGPNGSAKSTVAACIAAALEHYSTLDEGALYRFHWVFPTRRSVRGSIGFAERAGAALPPGESYAHLPDEELDARLFVEVRDHPLHLLPTGARRSLLDGFFAGRGLDGRPSDWVLRGELSHKNRQILDALLASNDGSLDEVLRHVQVERYYVSKRYRIGAATVGPQLSVDAAERQLTADRNLGSLPPSLQSVTLFEAFGELVDASGGILEFSDLLKRPLDAWKYLQLTVEAGEVPLRSQVLPMNCVMIGSSNETQLAAFRDHPEFESFRGRLELVRAPYLLRYGDEQRIYDQQIVPQARVHVAPHATRIAAMFAVLTRLLRPDPARHGPELAPLVAELTALEKLELYESGAAPERLDDDSRRRLRAGARALFEETLTMPVYEGVIGASPREMRTVLLDAAQDPDFDHLSPFAVLAGLDRLASRSSEYAWLALSPEPGGYHDVPSFRAALRLRLLDLIEADFQAASGLVEEGRAQELFTRYVQHVGHWVRGEKLQNPLTGALEDADARMMESVEGRLGTRDGAAERRQSYVSRIAAWAIDHPGAPLDHREIFAPELQRLEAAVFAEKSVALARLARDLVTFVRGGGAGLDAARKAESAALVAELGRRSGYSPGSAADAAAALVGERYAGVLA